MNYAKNLPRDTSGEAMQEYPSPFVATARYNKDNGAVSSVISLHPATSQVEVASFGGQGAVIRWVPLTETAAVGAAASVIAAGVGLNFDHYVPTGTYRRFVIPKETGGAPLGQTGSVNGLYQRLAVINAGITASSILLSEF